MDHKEIDIKLIPYKQPEYDLDKIIFDLDSQIDLLSPHADQLDCLIAVASGVLCAAMDILLVGEFDLSRGRELASDKVDKLVEATAEKLGWKNNGDLKSAVKYLEDRFPIPADGNTADFGGGLNHHLRDFAHHPTIVGLIFSLLTQFTYCAYGTDVKGQFKIVKVPEKSTKWVGNSVPDKIYKGTVIWFFHLVSDIAGSSSTAGLSGGTGIPGPILSLAKEISALLPVGNTKIKGKTPSEWISKVFNGTLFAQRDDTGAIIKDTVLQMDFRGELGITIELSKQALPIIANEVIVRTFFLLRRLARELKHIPDFNIEAIKALDWNSIRPAGNPTISRMLLISSSVFTAVDVGEAVISQKYWLSINYPGGGRLAIAIGEDISWALKRRHVEKIRAMYKDVRKNTYQESDDHIYARLAEDEPIDRFALTKDQVEILYNIECQKVLNDIAANRPLVNRGTVSDLKTTWLDEWKAFMELGFSSFIGDPNAKLHWYEANELFERIGTCGANETWFRLVLLEAMLFEPYYPLTIEKDKKGNDVPSKKYNLLHIPGNGYSASKGDSFLNERYAGIYCQKDFVDRIRKCYEKCQRELSEVLRTALVAVAATLGVTLITVATAGAFAPAIAVALVGSNFAGLSGAALTGACLAYLGGGAIAVGGAGMAGGTIAIVGGGAILGLGVGAGVGGVTMAVGVAGKRDTISQSAKLMTAVREIFLNDEHDIEYSDTVFEQYTQQISEIEKGLVDLRLQSDIATGDEKKALVKEIKYAEDSVKAMKIARGSMKKFNSSFAEGMAF